MDEFEIEVSRLVGLLMTISAACGLLIGAVADTPAAIPVEIFSGIFFGLAAATWAWLWRSILSELR